jgi:hypothetical protein
MAPPPAAAPPLRLDRSHQNADFGSWRLGAPLMRCAAAAALPAPVATCDEGGATGYVHARHSALQNRLLQGGGRLFALLEAPAGAVSLCEVEIGGGDGVGVRPLAGARARRRPRPLRRDRSAARAARSLAANRIAS